MLHEQALIRATLALAAEADVTFVGVGELGPKAPLYQDGFITEAELKGLQKAGAVGEIVGWAFDAQGKMIDGLTNDRVMSAPMPSRGSDGGAPMPAPRRLTAVLIGGA